MGVVGVILGTVISGTIYYMNAKQNHKLQKELNRIEKVEKTAIDFLVLMQKIFTFNLARQYKSKDKILIEKLNLEMLSLNEQVKAEMHFYFEKSDYDLAVEICAMAEPSSDEEAQKFNELRGKKIECLLNSIHKNIRE